jgi:hypothetical protein
MHTCTKFDFVRFEDGKPKPNARGDEIFCFFDYLWEPSPNIPPDAKSHHTSEAVRAADNWLVLRLRRASL